jgi:hypothetical protein
LSSGTTPVRSVVAEIDETKFVEYSIINAVILNNK